MKIKAIAATVLAIGLGLVATPSQAAVTAPKTNGVSNAVGVILKYRSDVKPVASNGDVVGANFAGVSLNNVHSIGDGYFAASFDTPIQDSEARLVVNNLLKDSRVEKAYPDHDFGVTPASVKRLQDYQIGIALGTLFRPASAPRSVKVVDALLSSAPNTPRVKVSWAAPSLLYGAKIGGYQVWRSVNGSAYSLAETINNPRVLSSYQSIGLQSGRITRFYVKAITKLGTAIKFGTASAKVSITPTAKPVAPSFTGYAEDYLQEPTWTGLNLAERGGLPVSYLVTATAENLPTLQCVSTATSCRLSTFDPGANYKLSIVATNSRGSSSSNDIIRSREPYFYEQWYLHGRYGINAQSAWAQVSGDYSSVVVAVVDSGFTSHPDLDASVVPGYDFVSNNLGPDDGDGWDPDASDPGSYTSDPNSTSTWHGTHVAGLIGAPNNGVGISGVAPGVKLQSVRALGSNGGQESDLFAAVTWASGGTVNGVPNNPTPAKVINISMGTTTPTSCGASLTNAYAAAKARGVTIVTAAGNGDANGNPMDAIYSYPGNCYGSINVAATSASGDISYYSNRGLGADLAAPGGDDRSPEGTLSDAQGMLISTYNKGVRAPGDPSYAFDEGTSMAAPLVSGSVALMYLKKPTLTPDQVWALLKAGVRPFASGTDCARTAGTTEQICGAGIVDIGATLKLIK